MVVGVMRKGLYSSYTPSVSRMTRAGEKFFPGQAMTREEALASYTLNNAIAAFEENRKGTLTPGKLADIVVLSQDIRCRKRKSSGLRST